MYPHFTPPIDVTRATDPPAVFTDGERSSIRRAAMLVKDQYPGVIGEYLARDLESIALMGFRLDQTGLTARTVNAILSA